MTVFFSQLINGLSLGSIYALIALGYSMVYGIILLLNFAHGDVIMVVFRRKTFPFVAVFTLLVLVSIADAIGATAFRLS